jgi:hypothetical protein
MKLMLTICALIGLGPVQAGASLCPANTTEVTHCKSTAVIAFYPYVSICSDGTKESLILDPGNNQQVDSYEVSKKNAETGISWSAIQSEESGELNLILLKNPSPKFNAILSFKTIMGEHNNKYRCH